jgi:hypothetical protein
MGYSQAGFAEACKIDRALIRVRSKGERSTSP